MAAVVSELWRKMDKSSEECTCEEASQYTTMTSRAFGRHRMVVSSGHSSIYFTALYIGQPCAQSCDHFSIELL